MATAPILPSVSVEEYLRTDYEPNCEYIDGVLVSKPLPDELHSRLQLTLGSYLLVQETEYGFRSAMELHTRIRPDRWRVPDLAVLRERPRNRYADSDSPPIFTVEIVSPDETWRELRGKVADHLAIGVQTVIIADPYARTVTIATQTEPLHDIAPPLIVTVAIPGKGELPINFDELFAQL